MRWLIVWAVVFGCVVVTAAGVAADEQESDVKEVGIGVIIGEPTGLTVKSWLDESRAIDVAAAWSFSGTDRFVLQANYLLHVQDWVQEDIHGWLLFYYGIGGRVRFKDRGRQGHKDSFSARIPVGLSYMLEAVPFEFFVEIAPALQMIPETDVELDAALGMRYYFR